jgi:nucleotide-binding universal stress UspA family protein
MTFMQRIAVGVDGSDSALRAIDFAVDLALARGAELVLVTVAEALHVGDQGLQEHMRAEHLTAWGDLVEAYASGILAMAKKRTGEPHGLRIRAEWRAGRAAEQLARFAREDCSDMLVVGHVGRSRLAGIMFGSVTFKLLGIAPCPLTVVR